MQIIGVRTDIIVGGDGKMKVWRRELEIFETSSLISHPRALSLVTYRRCHIRMLKTKAHSVAKVELQVNKLLPL